MIPPKIQALFDFIDYLDNNKKEYIEKYIPLCNELDALDKQRHNLKPKNNYKDKQEYDKIKSIIEEKFGPITTNIHEPIFNTLRKFEIWDGDYAYASIWNNNISVISEFTRNFESEDILQVLRYKQMYLSFRAETNTGFLGLSVLFNDLDEILKELFDFFKDTDENEFEGFEAKTIEVNSLEEVLKSFKDKNVENLKYSLPYETLHNSPKEKQIHNSIAMNIKNEIIMGDKIQVGEISENSGQITIGKDIDNVQNSRKVTNRKEIKKGLGSNNKLTKKSYSWQKWGVIIGAILSIIGILIALR
jgi:hypothetical protein